MTDDERKTDDEVLRARPREERNDAENDYLDALERLRSGGRPRHPDNARAWERGRLRINPSTVSDEAGRERSAIAGDRRRYGWIYRLIKEQSDVPPLPADLPDWVGPRGAIASLQASRSRLAAAERERETFRAKADAYDALCASSPKLRRGLKAPAGTGPDAGASQALQ